MSKMIVPIDGFYDYINSSEFSKHKSMIESRMSNVGKKSNYRKFAKIMKKAVKYLPQELEAIVREERSDGK